MVAQITASIDYFITRNTNCSDQKSLGEFILDVLPNTYNKKTTIY
jgi:hypothetical protein